MKKTDYKNKSITDLEKLLKEAIIKIRDISLKESGKGAEKSFLDKRNTKKEIARIKTAITEVSRK